MYSHNLYSASNFSSDYPSYIETARFEKSLGLLTAKFVNLLRKQPDGILDLKHAADALRVKQKRRIYDITNVLEGIGLIVKKNKNLIQWKGGNPSTNTKEKFSQIRKLQQTIEHFHRFESILDKQKQWIQQSIKNIIQEPENRHKSYITYADLCKVSDPVQSLLAIHVPTGTHIDVSVPQAQPSIDELSDYLLNLKSDNGPIEVFLINQNCKQSTTPLIQLVPAESDEPERLPNDQVYSHIQDSTMNEEDTLEEDEMSSVIFPYNSEVSYVPFIHLSPPPSLSEYHFGLDDSEGLCDIFSD